MRWAQSHFTYSFPYHVLLPICRGPLSAGSWLTGWLTGWPWGGGWCLARRGLGRSTALATSQARYD